jgi:hypothetical protein
LEKLINKNYAAQEDPNVSSVDFTRLNDELNAHFDDLDSKMEEISLAQSRVYNLHHELKD